MGGDNVVQPAAPAPAPSVSETSAEAIQAQIDALPKILAAQQQYGGQFSEEQLQSLQKYGPQFAQAALELQKTYAPQFAEVERSLSPELAGAQQTLANFLSSTDQAEYDALAPGLLQDVRAGQSQRGLGAISPLGSIDESVQLQRLKQSLKDRRLNVALSTAGRVPISSFPTVQGQTGTGQLVQNVNPESIFGYQQGLNNFNASVFGTQAGMYNNQVANQSDVFGTILGSVAGGVGGGLGTGLGYKAAGTVLPFLCWVAAEVFNEPMDGPNVSKARRFILEQAPVWFRESYIKYGQSIASFIHDKPILKWLLKPLFSYFAKRGA